MQAPARPYIGGQAVIEGVFMRAPRHIAVAVRKSSGAILVKAEPFRPFFTSYAVFRLPFVRGVFLLLDSLIVGMKALSWSAEQADLDQERAPDAKAGEGARQADSSPPKEGTAPAEPVARVATSGEKLALTGTLALSFLIGIAMFVALPHAATAGLSWLTGVPMDVGGSLFHVVDGVIKLGIFLGYLALIRRNAEIRRVFAYHGAEHKTIYAWELGLDLTLDNVRAQSRFHPRCGTSFLIFVVGFSIVVFAAVFPMLPEISVENVILRNLVQVLIKIPLIIPVASLSYETIRLSARFYRFAPARWLAMPGLQLQKLTTFEPDDRQMEVAIAALSRALAAEESMGGSALGLEGEAFRTGAVADVSAEPAR